jgi:hypothetical protein
MLESLSIQIQMTWNFSHILSPLWSIGFQSCRSKKAQTKEIWPKNHIWHKIFRNSQLSQNTFFSSEILRIETSYSLLQSLQVSLQDLFTIDLDLDLKIWLPQPLICGSPLTSFFSFLSLHFFPFPVSLLHLTNSYDITRDSQALGLETF